MFRHVLDMLIASMLTVRRMTLGSTAWNYLYNICYSFLDFEADKIPYTNYGYELRVDPANDVLDATVETLQSNLRAAVPRQYQTQWRSVNLYAAVLSLANVYKDRLKAVAGGKVASDKDNVLDGKRFVEVGCGRGGGCMALHGCCKPQNYIGVDISEKAVTRSRRIAENCQTPAMKNIESMDFKIGNSMMLDRVIAPDSADVVFNVESSHCYKNLNDFFRSTYNILKPGGLFIWADMQYPGDIRNIKHSMNTAGLKVRAVHDIQQNVSRSLRNGVLDPINEMYFNNYTSKSYISRCVYYVFWRLCAHVAPTLLQHNGMTYHAVICQKVVDQDLVELQRQVA